MSTIQTQSTMKQRSFSIVHHEAINFSTAQHKFSFGKGRRFPSLGLTCPTDFNTNLKSTITSNKSPTFGIGNRFKEPRKTGKYISSVLCQKYKFLTTMFYNRYDTPSWLLHLEDLL